VGKLGEVNVLDLIQGLLLETISVVIVYKMRTTNVSGPKLAFCLEHATLKCC
jgi:hypothetical protein